MVLHSGVAAAEIGLCGAGDFLLQGLDAALGRRRCRGGVRHRLFRPCPLLRRGRLPSDLDPEPEGKLIEAIEIDASPIILKGDLPLSSKLPWTLLNRVHVRTREPVIARELLFAAGSIFRRDLFEESGRNLRSLFILGVARLVVLASRLT